MARGKNTQRQVFFASFSNTVNLAIQRKSRTKVGKKNGAYISLASGFLSREYYEYVIRYIRGRKCAAKNTQFNREKRLVFLVVKLH